jgi:HD superfamily phosphohydrolase
MHWGARRHGVRVIRDPIHGDILLPKLAEAVVGSLEFQRLRYIRQNGLLHFVFPGAVHTRFAHSLGTMANAQAVWHRLTADLADRETSKAFAKAKEYLGAIFELSALLHDVGHCAFSHSAEKVMVKDQPLFGTMRELFTQWQATPMLDALLRDDPQRADQQAKHEEIGLLLIQKIFASEARLDDPCKKLGPASAVVGGDVIGLLHECPAGRTNQLDDTCAAFPPSSEFKEHARVFIKALESRWQTKVTSSNPVQQLRNILHDLVSGTLDVDRLDYLLRDATFCGVPYGRYDREILIGSLEIVPDAGRLYLTLDRKAAFALDDLLWSRYQMFIQVYNHKTNVVMDHMLGRALAWAIDQHDVVQPKLPEQYVAFTDDLVMGTVFSKCSTGGGALDTPFGRTLTRRSVPKRIGTSALKGVDKQARKIEIEKLRAEKENEVGHGVIAIPASSDLIKGQMPSLRVWEKGASSPTLEAFANGSSILQNKQLSASHHMVHFFEDLALVSRGTPTAATRPAKRSRAAKGKS